MPFLPFVYGYPSSSLRAHCTLNKSVPTLRYTCRHGPIYTGPCPKALTECSPLDFRRSSITAQVNTMVGYITSNQPSLRLTRCTSAFYYSYIYVSESVWFLFLLLFLPKAIFCIVYIRDCALPGLDLFSQTERKTMLLSESFTTPLEKPDTRLLAVW